MSAAVAAAAFLAGAVISLAVSWLLVSRLERVGGAPGLSEALLGLMAALAADAPRGDRGDRGRHREGRPPAAPRRPQAPSGPMCSTWPSCCD